MDFVQENNIGATITPHHLHINRNAMFFGGLNSDFYCLPVAKREKNRLALRKAATSGKECFFLGTDSEVDVFDREEVFIDRELSQIIKRFPKLKIVLEHITTSYAVDFVQENNIGATITPHHLHINRNAMFLSLIHI